MNHAITKEENEAMRQQFIKDIPFYHHLYAKYKDPKWLEGARQLGELLRKFSN